MSACLETSLCIGITKSRFDQFDKVKLKLKNEQTVEGVITDFDGTNRFYLETAEGDTLYLDPDDVEDYIG